MRLSGKTTTIAGFCLGLLLTSGCASLQERIGRQIEYIVPRDEASPGDVFHLGFVLPKEVRGGWVLFLDKKYRIYPRRDLPARTFTVFLPIPKVDPGEYTITCYFLAKKGKPPSKEELTVQILPDFIPQPVETVAARRFKVEGYIQERARIQSLLKKSSYKPEKLQDLVLPLGGEIVSGFGTVRNYQDKAEVALEGIEIVAVSASAIDVNTAADGRVILAEKLPMLGNCVLIDHGYSFATLYCHLRSFEVKAGQEVLRGDRLGLVGRTGGAAVGKRLLYQLFVTGTPVNVQAYTHIEIFE